MHFYVRKQLLLERVLAIAILSVRHTRGSDKNSAS